MCKHATAAALLFVLISPLLTKGGQVTQTFVRRDVDADGAVFTEDVLFDRNVSSKGPCSVLCAKTQACVTFTYTPLTSTRSGKCRGYSEGMTSASPKSSSAASTTFYKRETAVWRNQSCASDANCSAFHSRCFKGKCLCTPGFYYSVKRNFCIKTCPRSLLQSAFTVYRGSVLWDHDIRMAGGLKSQQQCEALCLAEPTCISMDLHVGGDCYLQAYFARDFPGSWDEDDIFDSSLRHCA